MLIELAIGDAYGAGFEYVSALLIKKHNDLSAYRKHPVHGLPPGAYTDDAQMSLAIAEAIISGEPWTPEMLAQRFVTVFKRDPRQGYARGFYSFLLTVQDGADFLTRIRPDSDKSGAAMRAAPLGVFKTIDEVVEKGRIQAAITHNTPDGINAALAAALTTHYFLYKLGPKVDLGPFIEAHVPGRWAAPYNKKVGGKGWMSARAAITALIECHTMSDLLKRCIAFSGDVDTVAAIAMPAGACAKEIEQDLPEHLHTNLENGPFGYDYIKRLDDQLLALSG